MHALLKPRIAIFDFFDFESPGEAGHIMAERLTARLQPSCNYYVIASSEWRASLPGRKWTQECRFHAPWAAHAGRLAGADAVVMGRLPQPGRREAEDAKIVAALLGTASGEIVAQAECASVDGLARALDSVRVAGRIEIRKHSIEARIVGVRGDAILLNTGATAGLARRDSVGVHRILETVADPCRPQNAWPVDWLSARIGEAEVLLAGPRASLARYTGSTPAQVGDLAIVGRHLSPFRARPAVNE